MMPPRIRQPNVAPPLLPPRTAVRERRRHEVLCAALMGGASYETATFWADQEYSRG